MNELPVSGQKVDQNLEKEFKPNLTYCKLQLLFLPVRHDQIFPRNF